jgi:L-lactate dehydrogenase complex protein LldG
MSAASRDKILGSIRRSLQARPQIVAAPPHAGDAGPHVIPLAAHLPVPTPEPEPTAVEVATLLADFRAALEALSGTVLTLPAAEVAGWLVALARERGDTAVLSWDQSLLPVPGLLPALEAAGLPVEQGELPHTDAGRAEALARWEHIKLGVTGADAVLAATGTLALRSGPGRPRLASLSVEVHVALVTAEQFYANWAAWVAAQGNAAAGQQVAAGSNYVLITGPSRTGDIEMTLTVGVHGPGRVIVVIVT